MGRLRKVHLHGYTLMVTFSVEEGLLFPCNPLIDLAVQSSLALAQHHHPVRICTYHLEGTHLHTVLVVDNPDDIRGFAERFKTESAHRINRILGRGKRTVWCQGYDSPILATAESVVEKIAYIYANPAKDGLAESIQEYPGLSSWKSWRKGKYKKLWKFAPRTKFRALSPDSHSRSGYIREAARIRSKNLELLPFELFPDAWMECFSISQEDERKIWNEKIIKRVFELEASFREERIKERRPAMSKDRLLNQVINPYHQRNHKRGRKMWCICSDLELRKKLIAYLKHLSELAREVYAKWKIGDFSVPFPLGLYPPAMPKLAHPVSISFL